MTPVERLQAAIEKLEHLKAASTPGDWEVDTNHPFSRDLVGLFSESVKAYAVKFDDDEQPARATVDLIVTLHRTINAQLAILQFGVKRLHAVQTLTGLHVQAHEHEMALADAILGSDS